MASSTTGTTATKKVILVTGANSGVGLECCLALARQTDTHVILAGRSQQRIDEAVTNAQAVAATSSLVEGTIVDLASLASVRQLARSLIQRDLQLYTIVCNAGMQAKDKTMTEDNFETTVGVNHVAHFLLVKLLQDRTRRIVMLSPETHDPSVGGGNRIADLTDLDAVARGEIAYNTMSIYATSKLFNLLHAKEFARRFPNGPEIVAYTPGFTPDTGLHHYVPALVWFFVQRLVCFLNWWGGGRNSTAAYSGGFLARLASEASWSANGWTPGDYIRVDEVWSPSQQACDPALAKALWEKTEEWIKPFDG